MDDQNEDAKDYEDSLCEVFKFSFACSFATICYIMSLPVVSGTKFVWIEIGTLITIRPPTTTRVSFASSAAATISSPVASSIVSTIASAAMSVDIGVEGFCLIR